MKKGVIISVFMLFFSIQFATAQQKHKAAQKKQDTIILATSGYVKIGDNTYNIQALQKALSSSIVFSTDQYWATLYEYLITAKNPDFSAAQVSQMAQPFMPYVERYQKSQKK